jgi:hypothetical protein
MRWVVALALAACSDPVLEMHLALPGSDATHNFDLSCTGAVAVQVIGKDLGDAQAEILRDCVDLSGPPQSFDDIQRAISGRFSFGMPRSGLLGVQLTGFQGSCNDSLDSHEAVFYGGAPRGGSDSLTIPLVPNISCGATQPYPVRVLDLATLTLTDTCAAPPDATTVFAADIHPRMIGDAAPRMMLERGVSSVSAPAGKGTVQAYAAAVDSRSCIALGYQGTLDGGARCMDHDAWTLCGEGDEDEVASLPRQVIMDSTDPALVRQYGPPVFGAVWELSDSFVKSAIGGATVALQDPAQGKVVYVDTPGILTLTTLTPIENARSTAASGLFVVYLRGEPTNLIVSAPGHVTQTLKIASAPDWPSSTLVAVLPRQ